MPLQSAKPIPLEVFYSYASKDERLRAKLDNHLGLMQRQGLITDWNDRMIEAGADWESEISSHLNSAHIILLLISDDFISSDYCYSIEMQHALEREERGEARVIPVILRPVDWESGPFAKLQALPTKGKPVTEWRNRDAAFKDIAQGIRKVIRNFRPKAQPVTTSAPVPRPPVFGFVARRDKEGRDTVEQLKEELAPGRNQLVTLSGPGGIGKTTLAAEAARGLHEAYAGRIVWSSAEGRADFTLHTLLDDIATQLGRTDLRQLALGAKIEQVRALVAVPLALVVLDNYETISPPAQKSIEEWFLSTPCSALFTSRPRVAETLPIQVSAMSRKEAEEFLGLLIGHTQVPNVFSEEVRRRIYETAEANPFVMKWVVAQIGAAQVPDVVLEELKQGEGDAAERVFNRSFNLPQLGDDGRAALLALSLFVPSASREALAEVAGFGNDRKRFDEAVKNMHALWLVRGVDGNRRLTIEGLTRYLTTAHLSIDECAPDFRQRFIAHFLNYAEAHSQATAEDFDALELEKDNLLGALDIAFQGQDTGSLIRIRLMLNEFLDVRGYWGEAVNTGRQALEAAWLSQGEASVAELSHNLAMTYHNRGELTEARRLYGESLDINRRLGNQRGVASTLHQLGKLAQDAGDIDEARRLYGESLDINRKLGDQRGVASTLHNLGLIAWNEADKVEAVRLVREALSIFERLGSPDAESARGNLERMAREPSGS